MKKLCLILGAVATALLLGALSAWACCGGSYVIEIQDIANTPDPVPCEGVATISFTVYAGMDWNYMDRIIAQVDIENADGDPVATLGPSVIGTIDLNDWSSWKDYFPASFDWQTDAAGSGQAYSYRVKAWTENADGDATAVIDVPGAGAITVESCCLGDVEARLTPATFNVQRAGNSVMAHVVLPSGYPGVTGGTIVSIGGIATSIAGTAAPGGPIRFGSAEFSGVAAQLVGPGDPRAEGVEVVIETSLEGGATGCASYAVVDIVNEGKEK